MTLVEILRNIIAKAAEQVPLFDMPQAPQPRRSNPNLRPEVRTVTRDGQSFTQTVYVKRNKDKPKAPKRPAVDDAMASVPMVTTGPAAQPGIPIPPRPTPAPKNAAPQPTGEAVRADATRRAADKLLGDFRAAVTTHGLGSDEARAAGRIFAAHVKPLRDLDRDAYIDLSGQYLDLASGESDAPAAAPSAPTPEPEGDAASMPLTDADQDLMADGELREGDTMQQNGRTYILHASRWHRRDIELESPEESSAPEPDALLGTSWDSPDGVRHIAKTTPDGRYLVTIPGQGQNNIMTAQEIAATQRRDAANLISRGKNKEAATAGAAARVAERDVDGFTDGMDKLHADRATAFLASKQSVQKIIDTARNHVRRLVGEGYRVLAHKTMKRVLVGPSGSFFSERDLGKIALDYAEFLSNRAESDQAPETRAAAPEAEPAPTQPKATPQLRLPTDLDDAIRIIDRAFQGRIDSVLRGAGDASARRITVEKEADKAMAAAIAEAVTRTAAQNLSPAIANHNEANLTRLYNRYTTDPAFREDIITSLTAAFEPDGAAPEAPTAPAASPKERLSTAYRLGREAQQRGEHSAPVLNADLMALIPRGAKPGESDFADLAREYARGWVTANLNAPIPEAATADAAARAPQKRGPRLTDDVNGDLKDRSEYAAEQSAAALDDGNEARARGYRLAHTHLTADLRELPDTMSRELHVGDTRTVNGRTYRLNDNHRWERVDATPESVPTSRFATAEQNAEAISAYLDTLGVAADAEPPQTGIKVGDTITDRHGLVRGVVTGEGTLGNQRHPIPAWRVTLVGGRQDGEDSVIFKDGATLVEPPEPEPAPALPTSPLMVGGDAAVAPLQNLRDVLGRLEEAAYEDDPDAAAGYRQADIELMNDIRELPQGTRHPERLPTGGTYTTSGGRTYIVNGHHRWQRNDIDNDLQNLRDNDPAFKSPATRAAYLRAFGYPPSSDIPTGAPSAPTPEPVRDEPNVTVEEARINGTTVAITRSGGIPQALTTDLGTTFALVPEPGLPNTYRTLTASGRTGNTLLRDTDAGMVAFTPDVAAAEAAKQTATAQAAATLTAADEPDRAAPAVSRVPRAPGTRSVMNLPQFLAALPEFLRRVLRAAARTDATDATREKDVTWNDAFLKLMGLGSMADVTTGVEATGLSPTGANHIFNAYRDLAKDPSKPFMETMMEYADDLAALKIQVGVPAPDEAPRVSSVTPVGSARPDYTSGPVKTADAPIWGFDLLGKATKAQRKNANVRAIEIATRLADTGQDPTEDELRTLAAYTGDGGLSGDLNAHYTPTVLAGSMWRLLTRAGFQGGTVLEPSCGAGVFLATAPEGARLTGVELSAVTGPIARTLHADAVIHNMGFEDYNLGLPSEQLFDAVIANPPYGERGTQRAVDKPELTRAEQYFMDTSLDRLKDGGLATFLVNPGPMMNPGAQDFRARLMARADILSVKQLPQSVFKDSNSGVPPIVITVRKRDHDLGYALYRLYRQHGEAALQAAGVYDDSIYNGTVLDDPANILGNWDGVTTVFHGYRDIKGALDDDTLAKLSEADLRDTSGAAHSRDDLTAMLLDNPAVSSDDVEGAFMWAAGRGRGGPKPGDLSDDGTLIFQVGASGVGRWHRLRDENAMLAEGVSLSKDIAAYASVLNNAESPADAERVRQDILLRINAFRDMYGNPRENKDLMQQVRRTFGLANLMAAFTDTGEVQERFKTPVADGAPDLGGVDTSDAASVAAFLSGRGRLTPRNLQSVWTQDVSFDEAQDWLAANYALTDDGRWVPPDRFYVGDAYARADALEAAATTATSLGDAFHADIYKRQAEHFRSLLGRKVLEDIAVTPRDKWLPDGVLAAFTHDVIDNNNDYRAVTRNGVIYLIPEGRYGYRGEPEEVADFKRYLNHATRAEAVRGQEHMTRAEIEAEKNANIEAARTLEKNYENMFLNWLSQSDYRKEVEDEYNKRFNGYINPELSGTLPLEHWGGPTLHNFQADAAQHLLDAGGGIMALDVGLGKTHASIAMAEMLAQTGRSKSTWFVPPKSLLANWRKQLYRDLPHRKDKILVIGETIGADGKAREDKAPEVARKLADAATGQYDIVLITRDWFSKIPVRPENIIRLAQEDLATRRKLELARETTDDNEELGEAFKGQKRHGKKSDDEKSERERIAEQTKAEGDAITSLFGNLVDAVYFEDLGIDALISDESHSYKNLHSAPSTFGQTPKFIGHGGESKRAQDFARKSKLLRERKGEGVYLLTATPTKNSPLEVFNMLQHVTGALESVGIGGIEDFQARYCEVAPAIVSNMDGSLKSVPAVVGFKNLNELRGLMQRYIYRRTGDEPSVMEAMKGGMPERVDMQDFFDMDEDILAEYHFLAQAAQDAAAKPRGAAGEDHLFSYFSKMRKLTLDPALYDPDRFGNKPNPRFVRAADIALNAIADGGKTVMFMDMGKQGDNGEDSISATIADMTPEDLAYTAREDLKLPNADKLKGKALVAAVKKGLKAQGQNAYDRLVKQLVASGIPREQIAVVTADTAKTSSIRNDIKERFNSGDLKVVIGSTGIIGEGFSLQKGTTDMVHLDSPWDPGTYWQRLGRAVRQGNPVKEVRNHILLAKGSFDALTFGTLTGKQGWTQQLWEGTDDTVDNTEANVNAREEMLAMLSADPDQARDFIALQRAEAQKNAARASSIRSIRDLSVLTRVRHSLNFQTEKRRRMAERIEVADAVLATERDPEKRAKATTGKKLAQRNLAAAEAALTDLNEQIRAQRARAAGDPYLPDELKALVNQDRDFMVSDKGQVFPVGGTFRLKTTAPGVGSPDDKGTLYAVTGIDLVKQTVQVTQPGGNGRSRSIQIADLVASTDHHIDMSDEDITAVTLDGLRNGGVRFLRRLHPDVVRAHAADVQAAIAATSTYQDAFVVTRDGKVELRKIDYRDADANKPKEGERYLTNTPEDLALYGRDHSLRSVDWQEEKALPWTVEHGAIVPPDKAKYEIGGGAAAPAAVGGAA